MEILAMSEPFLQKTISPHHLDQLAPLYADLITELRGVRLSSEQLRFEPNQCYASIDPTPIWRIIKDPAYRTAFHLTLLIAHTPIPVPEPIRPEHLPIPIPRPFQGVDPMPLPDRMLFALSPILREIIMEAMREDIRGLESDVVRERTKVYLPEPRDLEHITNGSPVYTTILITENLDPIF